MSRKEGIYLTHDVSLYLLLFTSFLAPIITIYPKELGDTIAFSLPLMIQQNEDFTRVCFIFPSLSEFIPQNHSLELILYHVSEPP